MAVLGPMRLLGEGELESHKQSCPNLKPGCQLTTLPPEQTRAQRDPDAARFRTLHSLAAEKHAQIPYFWPQAALSPLLSPTALPGPKI